MALCVVVRAVIAGSVSEPLVQILYAGPRMPADDFVCYVEAGEELRLHGLTERDPESVVVTNDELTHAVEGIMKVFDDLNPVLQASVQSQRTVLGLPPALSMTSLFPNDNFAQLVSPSSSFRRTTLNPIEVYQLTVALTSGT